jgi:sugar lactone lactonase YvrE
MPTDTVPPETLATGFAFPEGPRWHQDALWFSDMHGHVVLRLEADGKTEKIADVPECPSGLGFLPDGRLLIVSMHDRRVLRLDPSGLVEHADLSALAPWHLNDMTVDSSGRAYVGNFGDGSAPPDPPKPTVLIAIEPDGSARVVADDLHFPNGLVITSDGATLIVAETRSVPGRLTAFTIKGNGDLTDRRTLIEFGPGELPDGLAIDVDDGIWVAMPFSGEVVHVSAAGELDQRRPIDSPYAVTVGGANGEALFVCSSPTWEPQEAIRLRGGAVHSLSIA